MLEVAGSTIGLRSIVTLSKATSESIDRTSTIVPNPILKGEQDEDEEMPLIDVDSDSEDEVTDWVRPSAPRHFKFVLAFCLGGLGFRPKAYCCHHQILPGDLVGRSAEEISMIYGKFKISRHFLYANLFQESLGKVIVRIQSPDVVKMCLSISQ